jgi:hypothetical protein
MWRKRVENCSLSHNPQCSPQHSIKVSIIALKGAGHKIGFVSFRKNKNVQQNVARHLEIFVVGPFIFYFTFSIIM